MNRDDIIRMAREAGMRSTFVCADPNACPDDDECCHKNVPEGLHGRPETIERFANLVAAAKEKEVLDRLAPVISIAVSKAMIAEREACANACNELHIFGQHQNIQIATIEDCVAAIRARGQE